MTIMTNGNGQDISCLFYDDYDYGDMSGIQWGQRLKIVPVACATGVLAASFDEYDYWLFLIIVMIIDNGLFHPDKLKGMKQCAEET